MRPELERGTTVYLYLHEIEGESEDYVSRFPEGTPATVSYITEGAHLGLDIQVTAEDIYGVVEDDLSVGWDEVELSLRPGNSLLNELRESVRELREAEIQDGRVYAF